MPSSYTSNLRLVEQATGENSGTWGTILNTGMIALIDSAVAGVVSIATTGGNTTLTANSGSADQARGAILNVTGALTSDATIITPSGVSKIYVVNNATTGAHNLIMSSGGTTVQITQGTAMICYTDGTNFVLVSNASTGLQGTATGNIDMDNFLFDRPLIKRYKEFYDPLGNQTGSINLDYNNGNYQSMTLTGNVSVTPTNWPASGIGASMTLFCTQDGTGSRTLSFASGTVKVPGGGGLVLSTAPNAIDEVLITSFDGGTTFYCAVLKAFA